MKTRREFFELSGGAIAMAGVWSFLQDLPTDPVHELRDRHLELPVQGATRRDLRDSFSETRGSAHTHEAIDIMAPRNTPILAVEDGTIARLFDSKPGGTTVYQFDPGVRYAYYYAHLERYADGLQEGTYVQRGQVLGYVGTSGNAPKDTPHLHFAIFRLTEKKQWWHGSPIDPYDVLK
jgi:murein DD-endopeptidase MepM/ murein hydrolase activator NlpD